MNIRLGLAFLFVYFSLFCDEFDLFPNSVSSVQHPKIEDAHSNLEFYQPVAPSDCEPLASVADCVNVITGHFFQVEKDLQSTSIDPLHFVRYYDSGTHTESFLGLGFGSSFPVWASDAEKGSRHHYGMISARENVYLLYRDKEKGPSKYCSIGSIVSTNDRPWSETYLKKFIERDDIQPKGRNNSLLHETLALEY